jgi:YgiT-type zinc finger domain-containing protein
MRVLPDDPIGFIRLCVQDRRVLWTYHVNMRLRSRDISREAIYASVAQYQVIEAYPEDKYLPSYLVWTRHASGVLHVLFAVDVEGQNVRIVCRVPSGFQGMDGRVEKEKTEMICHVCGSPMSRLVTDLPFKRDEHSIVIIKELPVLQCANCGEYLLEDGTMEWVERILDRIDPSAELEIVRYAA